MLRLRLVDIQKLPIVRLIEENTDSQATAMLQAELIKKYNELEKEEDKLKERLKQTDPEAYQWLCHIDELQDKLIDELLYYANYIYKINHISNGLLKPFDVRGYQHRHEHVAPLFWNKKNPRRSGEEVICDGNRLRQRF